MKLFVYSIPPIDYWTGWFSEKEFFHASERWDQVEEIGEVWDLYRKMKSKGMEMAKTVGWEGDMRDGPYIAGYPTFADYGSDAFMIAWKQDNNGQTFVVSPIEIPWLIDRDDDWTSG